MQCARRCCRNHDTQWQNGAQCNTLHTMLNLNCITLISQLPINYSTLSPFPLTNFTARNRRHSVSTERLQMTSRLIAGCIQSPLLWHVKGVTKVKVKQGSLLRFRKISKISLQNLFSPDKYLNGETTCANISKKKKKKKRRKKKTVEDCFWKTVDNK